MYNLLSLLDLEGVESDMAKDSGRAQALDAAISQLRKRFGDGSIMKMGEISRFDVQAISTGSLALDAALGIGGVPRGRITEIFGPESSGKTTLAQHVIAEAQRAGGVAAFVDVEHALDPGYAAKCGVNVDDLYISQPDTGEQALEIASQGLKNIEEFFPQSNVEDGKLTDTYYIVLANMKENLEKGLSYEEIVKNTGLEEALKERQSTLKLSKLSEEELDRYKV